MSPLPNDRSFDWRRGVQVAGLLLLVIVVALFVVASVPALAGSDESYVVLSDSMSPSIKAGAVVFVNDVPANTIEAGEVITYRNGGNGPTTTHRVVEVIESDGTTEFLTQGDANDDPDPNPVAASAVVGTVAFHVPLMGYVVSFANTQLGLLALVVVPALLLIALELRDFWREMTEEDGGDAS